MPEPRYLLIDTETGRRVEIATTDELQALVWRMEMQQPLDGAYFEYNMRTGMKQFIGTKIVNMQPMTRAEYNIFRGWELPENENGADEGYLVEYLDGGTPNTPHYAGYVSWSPKTQADAAYRQVDSMTFGLALEALKKGLKVAREGWNGANQFVVCMPALYLPPFNSQGTGAKVNDRTAKHIGKDTPLDSQPYLALKNAQGKWQPGWLPSMGDLFADDWVLV